MLLLEPEMRELQRSINTYNMRYFPQHVLLCTSTVHDQSGDMHSGIFKDPLNRKFKFFKSRQYS